MSSAQRVEAAHHDLRPRGYMAGFPKWIVVVFVLAAAGFVATVTSDLDDRIMVLPIFFFGLVCCWLIIAVQFWAGNVITRRSVESLRAEARRIESTGRGWDV